MKKNFVSRAIVMVCLSASLFTSVSCRKEPVPAETENSPVSLDELARVFSNLPLEPWHIEEVHAAVTASSANGYDEEYMLSDVFLSPGSGVGASEEETKAFLPNRAGSLRDVLREYLERKYATKSDGGPYPDAESYISALIASDAQIYWPYSEEWDGTSYPVVTFNPGTEVSSNVGYRMSPDGSAEEVVVNEEKAMNGNVWVINRNEDSGHLTLEMLRRQNPDWGHGGCIVVKSGDTDNMSGTKTLVLKSFEARRNFDTWFCGGSEFFCRSGAVEDFQASTEAEMYLYSPSITDFMVVVKRSQVGQPLPFNAVLISEWTDQLQALAFMITEDDGGTRTTWKCSAMVKIQSKSYGFEIELPLNSRDDIVWRGQISRKYLEKNNDVEGHFGDAYLTFALD